MDKCGLMYLVIDYICIHVVMLVSSSITLKILQCSHVMAWSHLSYSEILTLK